MRDVLFTSSQRVGKAPSDRGWKQALSSDPPQSVHIPGIAVIRIRPDLPKGQSGMGGIEVSPQGKMSRILTNGILEAAEQLRTRGPGSVVISGNFTPPEQLLDVVLRAVNRANPSQLASVAVVVITGSYGSPPVIWKNTLTPRRLTDDLADTFRAILSTLNGETASSRRAWLGDRSEVERLGGVPRPEFDASDIRKVLPWPPGAG